MLLGVLDDQRMILVEEFHVMGKILHEEGTDILVTLPPGDKAKAGQESSSVSIHHECWLAAGIEKDGIGSLRADTLTVSSSSRDFRQ